MGAIGLGFASAVVWGFADFLGGLKSRQLPLLMVLFVSQATALVVVAAIAIGRGEGIPEPGTVVPWAVAAAVAGTVGLAAFYRGLSVGAMGVVAPISSCAAIIPVVVGIATGERPGALQLAGVAVAVAGVAATSYEPGATVRKAATAGVGLALVAALGFGLFFVALDRAADRDLLWTLLIGRMTSSSVLGAGVLFARPSFRMTDRDLRAVMLVGLLDVSANGLYAAGTSIGLVSVVAVLGSLYPVTTVVLARVFLGERLRPSQRAGAVAALTGVALISAG